MTAFGRYLREQRIAAKKSLRAVAELVGVTHVYLGEVERGVRGPLKRERWAALIAAVPGITVEGLERAAATTRPVRLALDDDHPKYRDLGVALARRIERKDLDDNQLRALLDILSRQVGEDDDE